MNITDFELFRNLPCGDRANIVTKTRRKTFRRGDTIGMKGTRLEHVYFISKGRVKESACTRSGKEIVYNIFTTGECFGLARAFNVEPSKADFVAIEDSEMFYIGVEDLKKMAEIYPSVLQTMFAEFTRIASRYSDKLYEIRALDVSERTRAALLRHAQSRSVETATDFVEIENLPTHEEIANTIFTHREAVTREISRLREIGAIIRTDKNLLAANIGMLQEMLREAS